MEGVNKKQLELDVLNAVESNGARIRAKEEWIEKGEKNSKYFLNLEKFKGKQKVMSSLKMENGEKIQDQDEIMNYQRKFYSAIYGK